MGSLRIYFQLYMHTGHILDSCKGLNHFIIIINEKILINEKFEVAYLVSHKSVSLMIFSTSSFNQ